MSLTFHPQARKTHDLVASMFVKYPSAIGEVLRLCKVSALFAQIIPIWHLTRFCGYAEMAFAYHTSRAPLACTLSGRKVGIRPPTFLIYSQDESHAESQLNISASPLTTSE